MKFYINISLFFIFSILNAQEIVPFIENYTKQDYNGDNQIWSIAQGNDKALYFANNHYFIRYNGVIWEKYTLPNKTIIRSVYAYKNLIFSGSFNEFGYWQRLNGKMKYISLVPKNFISERKSEEIWKIFELKGKIYFQTFNEIYIYDFKKISVLKTPGIISYIFNVNQKIYAATVKNGIFEIIDNKFIYKKQWELLKTKIIHSIESNNNKIYFFTQKNGIYIWENESLTLWTNPLQEKLKNELINAALFINNDQLIVGTASGGVYIVNINNNSYLNFNRNTSLQNNSILSIAIDQEKDIWLGLDNGIAHIEINSPFRFFNDKTGILGSVYTIAPYQKGYLLGTNHGLFTYQDKKISMVNQTQGQVWNIYKNDNQYVIGHNNATFLFKDNNIIEHTSINGGYNFYKDLFNDRYLQSNYTGFAIFPKLNHFENAKNININIGPLRNFAQISNNEIIAVHNYKGIYKITHSPNFENYSVENLTQKSNILNDFGAELFKYKNEVLFFVDNNWYYYDKIDNSLKIYNLFQNNFRDISEIIPINNNAFAVIKNNILYIINQNGNTFDWRSIPPKLYAGRLITNETKISYHENKYLFNLDDGFMVIEGIQNKLNPQKVNIEAYYKNTLINKNKIPNNETVEVIFVSDYFGNQKPAIFYSINQDTIRPVFNGKLVLNNLRSGNYKIIAYFNESNKINKISETEFYVKKPWFASFWMLMLYAVLIIIVFYTYYRWNKLRFKEKLKLHEEELKHKSELQRLEIESKNQLKIQELEKVSLENQVHLKANELAGKSLSLAKQTELIESIQSILETEYNVSTLKSKITKAIKINRLNKNEWKSFENNLLKSNEEFVRSLTQHYPQLTSKDIKLCIYLKMNLSSKEIAPLMNISYRGVELHRYRLRKKMELNPDVNLNTFMNLIK